ncbi:MAG: T9SS type A sorting domain-containing protein, partial [Flavobacteriales bacterium]
LVDVTLVIKNLGTDTLQSLLISIGGAVADQSVEWSGSLPSYSSDTLVVSGAEILTDANIRCQIETVNLNAANDTVRVRADVGLSTQLVRLELALDAYPDDVSWEIRNETDSVLYNGGGYEVDYQYISNVFQLPTVGCYNFYLHDTNGDGLHGSQYGGFDGFCKLYSMTDSSTIEEELFFYDGSYDFSPIDNNPSFLQYTFEAGSSLQVNEQLSAQWLIYPNPANGELNINVPGAHESIKIRVVDTTGKLHLEELMPAGQYLHTIDLQQLSNGYYILVTESKGQRTQQSFIVTHN